MEHSIQQASKPRIGVVFFAAKWFEEVISGSDYVSREFKAFIENDTKTIIDEITKTCDIVHNSVVTSMEKARASERTLLGEGVDAVLFCFLVWSEDEYLLPFRDLMTITPSLVWLYRPFISAPLKSSVMDVFRNSGLIGNAEGSTVLRKMGVPLQFIAGSSLKPAAYSSITRFARAAKVRREFRTAKLGILPYHNNQMIATYVDEYRLYADIGPYVDHISVLQFKTAMESIPEATVRTYARSISEKYQIDNRVSENNLILSAQASLGLEKIIHDRALDGLALGDLNPELLEVIGCRPVLYPDDLARSEAVVGNEGDLGCATAMVALRKLTGNPVMLTEFFAMDPGTNTIAAGHAGAANHLLADEKTGITITPDFELVNSATGNAGVWMEFIAKPGRITLVNFICTNDSFQASIAGGESLGGPLRIEGYPHFYFKLDPDIEEFYMANARNGADHHWAIVHGDVREEMSFLADIMKVKKVVF